MANTKEILISGWMHFSAETILSGEDFRKGVQDKGVMEMLAYLNLPSVGVRIHYSGHEIYLPNEHNGQTCFVQYEIQGMEAIWTQCIQEWIAALWRVGVVTHATMKDLDDGSGVIQMNTKPTWTMKIHDDILRKVELGQ